MRHDEKLSFTKGYKARYIFIEIVKLKTGLKDYEKMVLFAFIDGVAGGFATIACAQPDILKIENKYTKRLKTPVTINHKNHVVTIACVECHHEWKREKGKETQKCAMCHKKKGEGKELGLKKCSHTAC